MTDLQQLRKEMRGHFAEELTAQVGAATEEAQNARRELDALRAEAAQLRAARAAQTTAAQDTFSDVDAVNLQEAVKQAIAKEMESFPVPVPRQDPPPLQQPQQIIVQMPAADQDELEELRRENRTLRERIELGGTQETTVALRRAPGAVIAYQPLGRNCGGFWDCLGGRNRS